MSQGFQRQRRRVVQALCASAATAGCSLVTGGPLTSAPRWWDPSRPRPPVVFVHGAFGSQLRNARTGREIWPVGMGDLLVSSYAQLALPIDPDTGDAMPDDIIAYDLFDDVGVVEFYGSLVSMLTSAGGYHRATVGTPVEDASPRLYAFLYDWRRDFSRAAVQLAGFIARIRADYGQPDLKVDLVAHSSGGLVSRYFLLYGGRSLDQPPVAPDFSGCDAVARVVAIGVPEIGMSRAAASLVEGEPLVFNRVFPEVLATAHSPFQLLPHGDDVWLVDAAGRPMAGDSCDPALWRELKMGVFDPEVRSRVRRAEGSGSAGIARLALLEKAFAFRLQRARRFREALRAAPVPGRVPYFSIGGDCRETQARLLIEPLAGEPRVRTRPDAVRRRSAAINYERLMRAPGDGMVTRASVTCEPDWPAGATPVPAPAAAWRSREFVCASHNQLVVNTDCQRALLHALAADVTATGGAQPAGGESAA